MSLLADYNHNILRCGKVVSQAGL